MGGGVGGAPTMDVQVIVNMHRFAEALHYELTLVGFSSIW
jgi:hypothetical protein